jgi:membrane protease YdiL (CAAX protease family)
MSGDSSDKTGFLAKLKARRANNKAGHNFGPPILVIANVLAIFILSQILAAFIAGAILSVFHPHSSINDLLNNSAGAEFLYVFLAEATAVGLVLMVLKNRGLWLNSIGLGRRPKWNDLKKAIIAFFAFYVLLIIANLVLSQIFPALNSDQTQDVGFNSLNGQLDKIIAFVALVILPPLGEEPLVRGYLFGGLRSRWKFWPAAIVTSLMFGAAHLDTGSGSAALWSAGLDTFILSMVLVYLREKSGALYAGILVHMLNNMVAFAIHFHG